MFFDHFRDLTSEMAQRFMFYLNYLIILTSTDRMASGGAPLRCGQGCEWSTVRAKRRWDAANDCSTVAAARTLPTRRRHAAVGSMSAEENGTFLTRQAGRLCEGDRFGESGVRFGRLCCGLFKFFETTPPLAAPALLP